MEALGNISATSRSLTKNSNTKPKVLKKEEAPVSHESNKDTSKTSINKNDSVMPSNVSSSSTNASSDKVNILANINNRVIMIINKNIYLCLNGNIFYYKLFKTKYTHININISINNYHE